MNAPARLTGLRVLGFKSFAERTTVEFGAGISAVIGPNGSGKSNLADALRWTLGEAGRSLRTRRAEDVIFAGSSARRATGMADVTLVFDNADRLLPVDFGEVELGRRLYRSGENEYLLNRQRIRLRDLLDLLDAGNLADNAFLFIGQGMVDQALALRPEERRPLFEEAAGVRRHERRRRQAESELAEAEANLERVRDVLAELRPQARRLAAQAEQLLARRSAGHELAIALVATARGRWHDLASTAKQDEAALAAARADADGALVELRAAEDESQQLSRALADRAERESSQRSLLDERRVRSVELRLAHERVRAERAAGERERERIAAERAALAERAAGAEAELAGPLPVIDAGLSAEVEALVVEIERARRGVAGGPAAPPPVADLGTLERRRASLATQVEQLSAQLGADQATVEGAELARGDAEAAVTTARTTLASAQELAASTRAELERATVDQSRLVRADSEAAAALAGLRSRIATIEQGLAAAAHAALGRAVRARGGSLAAEGLETDPALRHAVAAALGHAAQAWLVGGDEVAGLPRDGGTLLVRGAAGAVGTARAALAERQLALARAAGGGQLLDAIRRDPQGEVSRLLGRTLWVPRLEDALRLRGQLAAGWQVVTIDGQLLTDQGLLQLAASDRLLALREERATLVAQLPAAEEAAAEAAQALPAAARQRDQAQSATSAARQALEEARSSLALAEEVARTSQRRLDAALRDQALRRTRLAGLEADASDVAERIGAAWSQRSRPPLDTESELARLMARHAALSARLAEQQAVERSVAEGHRRAEVTLAMTDDRTRQLDAEAHSLAGRQAELESQAERLAAEEAAAVRAESEASAELEVLISDAGQERRRLVQAEAAAAAARERLRSAEARSRAAEVASMEALLKLDAQREQLLVELAGIGADALPALVDGQPDDALVIDDDLSAQLAQALEAATARWQAEPPVDAPSPSRLSGLRRRFHELGAGNPFAAAEYAEARARLETLDRQADDLETAIGLTRRLIDELNELIASQFRATFTALEDAFGRRFKQLFDGGEAELALTAPDDLAATGIEITARPPGKKRQPLQMLSGGERALTAVALLLAMLEVRPVPFCVLDEVDAALDEANISRFAQALRGLADRTQFIVITHNRGTIEMADALYGVTIGSDAVSRIVSLRLPPAAASGANGHAAAEQAAETEVLA